MDGKETWTVADALDYRGFPADKSTTGGWICAAQILVIEACKRLTTMGIAVNLVTYLTGTMHLHSAASANIVTDFMGTSLLLCLLSGFLADSFLGRYMTIAIFTAVQAVGVGILTISTALLHLRPPLCDSTSATSHENCKQPNGLQLGVFYLSLYVIALGTGRLKSSVSGFGTDQFDEKDEKEKTQMTLFFSRFFFFISTGTLLAVTVLVYLQDEVGRSWAYGICCVALLLALFVFLSGTTRYRYKKGIGSPVVHIFQVIAAALKKRKLQLPSSVSFLYEDSAGASRINHTDQFCFLDKAAIIVEGDFENASSTPNPWKLSSVTRVEEVKMMIRLQPIWATTIMFWTTYAQMITFSVEQASTMERSIGRFQIPAGSLTFFFVGTILITLAIYDRIIIPVWKKWKGKHGFTNLQRIWIGLLLSILGMAAASGNRLGKAAFRGKKNQCHQHWHITHKRLHVDSSILFGRVGRSLHIHRPARFLHNTVPKRDENDEHRTLPHNSVTRILCHSFLVSVVKSVTGTHDGEGWLASNINKGRLDLFYALLAVMSFINMGFFLLCTNWYNPQMPKRTVQMEERC